MGLPDSFLLICLTMFVAALVKASLGFGESMLAIPLLTMILGVQMAGPLIALIVFVITGVMLIQNWQRIDLHEIHILTGAAVVGVPVGIFALKALPSSIVTSLLGWILMFIGLYLLFNPALRPVDGIWWTLGFGFASGVFGGAYNIAGAPIIVYGALRRWDSAYFRGSLQSYFLVVSIIVVSGHAISGFWTRQLLQIAVYSIPAIAVGYWVGYRIADKVPKRSFETVLYVVMVSLGLTLIF
ncbi:MAG: sulfite exporter TauE/SafE family protein [Chloroflexota bacterium]